MTLQGVLFFDRMTEDVLDGIRSELEVSRVCQHFGTCSYLMVVVYGVIHSPLAKTFLHLFIGKRFISP